MRLPEAVHQALVADTARAMARKTPAVAAALAAQRSDGNRALLDNVLPADAVVGIDHGNGKDRTAVAIGHMEGSVLVVDQVRYYCPEHAFTPPEYSGLAFCPYCEFPDLIPADLEGAAP